MTGRPATTDIAQRERALAMPLLADAAASTQHARRRDIAYFWRWAELARGAVESYPIPRELLASFVSEHMAGLAPTVRKALVASGHSRGHPLRVGTLRRMISSLSVIHLALELDNPCRDPAIHFRLRRQHRQERPPQRRRALTRPLIEQLCATCGEDTRGRRDRAVLTLGFAAGGLRRSELSSIDIDNLRPHEAGFQLILGTTKAGRAGTELPVRGVAAEALHGWLAMRDAGTGPLFVGLHRAGRQLGRLSGRGVDRLVANRARQAGLDPEGFGAHSLRAGYLTEAGRQGLFLGDAMQMSRHRSLAIALGYYERGRIETNPGADLLSP